MEIHLHRTDFAQVGTTNRRCMRVIPANKEELRRKTRGLDKVVVGSQNGCVICICRKNSDTQIVYKTLPGPPVECVCLGGALGTVQDKVFVAADNTVKGISKKGKQFFAFETNMAEAAQNMFIYGVELVLIGKKSYNHYHDCSDANYLLCNDDINDVVCLATEGTWVGRGFTSVLACNDSTIKVVEGSSVDYEIPLSDIPFTLYLFMGDGGYNKQHVLYGTKNGRLGLVELPQKKGSIVWETSSTTASAITCITCYKFCNDNTPDIIVGKEDGLIEIYNVDESDRITFKQSHQCDESITSICCGRVTSESMDEIIVCTYTGWLFALSRIQPSVPPPPPKSNAPPSQNISIKVQQLKNELDELESKVNEERSRYEELTKRDGNTAAFVPHFQVHDTFAFNNTHGAYSLTIELVIPIDYVVIQSEVPVRLVEVEKNSAVISYTPITGDVPWSVLATYRCQANTTRIELRLKIDEGNFGLLHVYVCPKIHPKMSQVRSYELKPLAMHARVHQFDATRPLNVLSFIGNFSLAEAHAWLGLCLPNIPPKCPPSDTVTFNFQSSVNGGTQLQATYSRGSAVFRSDSISAIAIIRDRISEETTKRQIKVNITCDLNEKCMTHCLQLLHPKMLHLHNIERRKNIAMALRELEANTDDVSWMSEEYAEILNDHDKIFEEAERDSLTESSVMAIYEDLLIDRGRLTGRNSKGKVSALRELLTSNYSLENVIHFFHTAEDFRPAT